MIQKVAVLFVTPDSIYKTLPGCDCYDEERDARTYSGGMHVVAHPPCRLWGRLKHLSTAPIEEKELAIWAVGMVREHGGVLEHPQSSSLWSHMGLPRGGSPLDAFGGFTLDVDQYWWGHRAQKRTWLYICGVARRDLPPTPLKLGRATHTISNSKTKDKRPEVSLRERSDTPVDFATWLVEVARRTNPPMNLNKNTRTCRGCRALDAVPPALRFTGLHGVRCTIPRMTCSMDGVPLQPCPKPLTYADYLTAIKEARRDIKAYVPPQK